MSSENTLYQCPGEPRPIDRETHLGRLASFFPQCRHCPSCDDAGALPKSLAAPLFLPEGAGGVYLNQFTAADARQIAAAFGLLLRERRQSYRGYHRTADADRSPAASGGRQHSGDAPTVAACSTTPSVLVAGDGRPRTPELLSAVCDGLRWSGCRVIDIGAASAPCLVATQRALSAAGALLVGNASGRPETSELRFWQQEGAPLSSDDGLDVIEQIRLRKLDRPTRAYASLARGQAAESYLAELADDFHALRPLRFVVDTAGRCFVDYLRQLAKRVACQVIVRGESGRASPGGIARRVVEERADFGFWADGDGEACRVIDERGRHVPAHELLALLAAEMVAQRPGAAFVLESDCSPSAERVMRQLGGQVTRSGASRAAMHRTMRQTEAVLGGGPSGRYWFQPSGGPLADALKLLALLLTILSRGDRPLSDLVLAYQSSTEPSSSS